MAGSRGRRMVAGTVATAVAATGFVALSPFMAPVASADVFTLTVNSPNVDEDGTSPGACAGAPLGVAGECTLQAAMTDAQILMGQGHDVIVEFLPSLAGVTFQPGTGFNTANPALYSVSVPAGRLLQINGPLIPVNLPIVLDGNNENRIFDFAGAGDVVIRDLHFVRGNAEGIVGSDGGAIRATTTLTMERVTVQDSFAENRGGGIASSNNLSLSDSNIFNNVGDGGGGGIAVDNAAAEVTISTNTQIAGNNNGGGGGRGGGIECLCATLRVDTGAFFSANLARDAGAGIYAEGVDIVLSQTSMTGNDVFNGPGGAIYAGAGSTITMNGGTLASNLAATDFGGAIACECVSVSLNQVDIDANQALLGGGVYISAAASLTISNSEVKNNAATVNGGAISSAGGSVGILQTTMDSNTAGNTGGAIDLGGSGSISVTDSVVRGSAAFTGAGLHCQCVGVSVTRSLIELNTSTNFAGGVYSTGPVSVVDSRFFFNQATNGGGGIVTSSSAALSISGSVFDSNFVTFGNGGGFSCGPCGPIDVTNSAFVSNSAQGFGAGAGIQTDAVANFSNTTFSGNTANSGGGALWLAGTVPAAGLVQFDNVTFADHVNEGAMSTLAVNGVAPPRLALVDSIFADNQDNCDIPLGTVFGGTGVSIIEGGGCPFSGPTIVTGDPGLLPLQDVGGPNIAFDTPIPVHPIQGSSIANDVDSCEFGDRDARGFPRSTIACDLGAFELDLIVGTDLDSNESSSPSAVIPLSAIPAAALTPPRGNGSADSQALTTAQVRGIDIAGTPLRNIPLRNIGLASIELGDDVLGSISLAQIPLAYDGGWTAYLTAVGLTDLAAQPLNTVTLATFLDAHEQLPAEQQLDLDQLDLSATPLGSLSVGAVALAGAPLDELAGETAVAWCATYIEPFTDTPCNDTGVGAIDPNVIDTRTATLVTLSLEGVPLRNIPLRNIPLRNIDLDSTPLRNIPLRNIPLRNIDLSVSPLRNIPLRNISVEGAPLRNIELLASPLRNIPLRNIDLSASPLRNIPLRNIPLRNIGELEASPLRNIPLRNIDIDATPLRNIPLRNIPLRNIGDVVASPLRNIPLRNIDLSASPLRNIPLGNIDLNASPLRNIPLRNIADVNGIVDCNAVNCLNGDLLLGDVALAQTATLGGLYDRYFFGDLDGVLGDITFGPNDTYLLADIASAFQLAGSDTLTLEALADVLAGDLEGLYTLGDLAAAISTDPIGEQSVYDLLFTALTVADVLDILLADADLSAGGGAAAVAEELRNLTIDALIDELAQLEPPVTLADLFLGVFAPDEFAWEELDLDAAGLGLKQETPSALVEFPLLVKSTLSTADYDVTFTLPDGFEYAPGSLFADPDVSYSGEPIVEAQPDGTTLLRLRVTIAERAPAQEPARIRIAALPPFDVGDTAPIVADVTAVNWAISGNTENDYRLTDLLEFNDTPEAAIPLGRPDDQLVLSFITPNDVDFLSFDVPQGEEVSMILSNLPADYDLLVFAPATDTTLRGAASRSLVPAADNGLSLLGDDVTVAQIGADVDTTPPPGYRFLEGSTRRGTENEQVETGPLAAGRYLVKIVGYNGAASPRAYALRVKSAGSAPALECAAVEPAGAALSLGSTVTTVGPDTDTIVLVDTARLARSYGETGPGSAADVIQGLDVFTGTLAGAPADRFGGTRAAVVDLATIPAVRAANDVLDAQPCDPQRANGVVAAIGGVLDSVLTPAIRNVVIVGTDEQIPMARVRDNTPAHNEQEYAETFDVANPVSASQALGYVLTDDAYATSSPIAVGARDLFVPDLAVGRLVETPTDIANSLANFVAFDGRLDPQTAISTGYDFLEDGARAVADELADPLAGVVAPTAIDETLISTGLDAWTKEQLAAQFAAAGPDVSSVNAHFDHYRALPADQDAAGRLTNPLTTDDVRNAPAEQDGDRPLLGSLVFSMGCHSGLSVSDINVGALSDDWAETFASQGAAMFAGNTGYGYGDTEVVAFSEELMRLFAERLGQAPSIGAAMAAAKQRYVSDLAVVSPFEEKVSSQVVFYGLPMYRIDGVTPPPVEPFETVVVDPISQLPSATVTVAPGVTPAEPAATGTYYTVNGEIQATPYQPVQPRTSTDVTAEGRSARGALITSLVSDDVAPVDPVVVTPIDDATGPTIEAPSQGAVFPSALQSVAPVNDLGGRRDRLVLVPGQFRGFADDPAGLGVQRLFTEIGAQVFYAPDGNTDTVPPRIVSTQALVLDGQVAVEVEVGDLDVARVLVLYIESNANDPKVWRTMELTARDATHFVGTGAVAPGTTQVDYFVQVLDTGGNVSVSSDKGTNFSAVVDVVEPPAPGAPALTIAGPTSPTGAYSGVVTVSAVPADERDPVTLTVNGAEIGNPVELSTDGIYRIVASTPGVEPVTRTIVIAGAPPTVAATVSPAPNEFGWYTAVPVTVDISATPGTSSIASVRYRVGNAATQTVPGETASVAVTAEGEQVVSFSAVDTGGRSSITDTASVRIDTVAPNVTVSAPAQVTQGDVFDITCTATDATSGVAGGDCVTRTVDSGLLTPGAQSFTFTATDAAGLSASRTVVVNVIAANTAPVVKADMGVAGLETIGFQSAAVLAVGSFTDAEGNGPYAVSVRWGSGPFTSFVLQADATFAAPWILFGTAARTVTVRVCDIDGACGTDTLTIRPNVTTRVTPIARCVADRGASVTNRYEARWAYNNPATFAIAIPAIPYLENTFSPAPTWRNQPQIFLPGTRNDVFRTTFSSGTQTWRVNGTSATARTTTTRC